MKRAFSLIEVLIVLGVVGIIAAIVVPMFLGHIATAKETAARDNLRVLRNAIELYAAKHNNTAPGYEGDNISKTPTEQLLVAQLIGTRDTPDGNNQNPLEGTYLQEFPENPFNNKTATKIIVSGQQFPQNPSETDTYGWIYQPSSRTIRLNTEGFDKKGIRYFDY